MSEQKKASTSKSFNWVVMAWRADGLKSNEKLVLLQIAWNADDRGVSRYSVQRMALNCCMSERSLTRHLKVLVDKEFIQVKERPGTSNIIRMMEFNISPIAKITTSEKKPSVLDLIEMGVIDDEDAEQYLSLLAKRTTKEKPVIAEQKHKFSDRIQKLTAVK